jgi:hypothetical protein
MMMKAISGNCAHQPALDGKKKRACNTSGMILKMNPSAIPGCNVYDRADKMEETQ